MNADEPNIIKQVYINLQLAAILQEYSGMHADPYDNSDLATLIRKIRLLAGFDDNIDMTSYSFLNQGVLLTSLWGLIVYPKETFGKIEKQNKLKPEARTLLDSNVKDLPFIPQNISLNKGSINFRIFLRRLRNSISHNNISFTDKDFVFTDINIKKDARNDKFEVIFTTEELFAFLRTFKNFCLYL